MHLSPKQARLLKTISKKTVTRDNKYKLDDVEYLRSLGLITACCVDKEDDFFYQAIITEKGKAILYERSINLVKYWIPILISNAIAIAALIVSCTK